MFFSFARIIKYSILLMPSIIIASSCCWCGTDVYIGIEGRSKLFNVGLASFLPKNISIEESKMSRSIEDIVRYDLLFSLYFNLVEGGPIPSPAGIIDYKAWAGLGADVLVTAGIEINIPNISAYIKLYDTNSGELIWEQRMNGIESRVRQLSHAISDEIIMRLTGERGIAQTKIAFVSDTTGNKELYICDYDGYNIQRITFHRSIVLFPQWSPRGDTLCFTSYRDKNPDLFLIKADGSNEKALSIRQGLNTAARWAPHGQLLAITLSFKGNPDIYLIDTHGNIVHQLTRDYGAETSPDFSPSGTQIVYTSDLPGYPQLYVINVDGNGRRRLLSGQYSDTPAWSPRGDRIAFSMVTSGKYFDIYTVDIFGNRSYRLTFTGSSNENPSWSPDGRFLVFTKKIGGITELWIMNAEGSNARQLIKIKGNCFTPSWSPYGPSS